MNSFQIIYNQFKLSRFYYIPQSSEKNGNTGLIRYSMKKQLRLGLNILNFQEQMKGFHTSMTTLRVNEAKTSPRVGARKLMTEDNHEVNEYGMLNKALSSHLRRKKKKKAQAYSDSVSHCQSLEKLQLMNVEKNEEIKRYIYEKAEIYAYNEELKQMINNPTLREHQLHMRISELEESNKRLTLELEKREEEHCQQVQRIKAQHKLQLQYLSEGYKAKDYQEYLKKPQHFEHQLQYNTYEPTVKITEPDGKRSSPHQNQSQYPQRKTNDSTVKYQTNNNNIVGNQAKPYVIGSPVYISANRNSEQTKTTVKQQSNNTTTSQTRVVRGNSPTVITYTSSEKEGGFQSQRIERQEGNRNFIERRQKSPQPTLNYQKNLHSISRPNENVYTSNIKRAEVVDSSRTGLKTNFAQGDLQDIYKRYCIND